MPTAATASPARSGLKKRAARADLGDLLHGQHRVEHRAAGAAILLRDHDPEKALLRHELRDIPGESHGMRARHGILREVALGEAAHHLLEGGLFLVQPEIHGIRSDPS
jgi:hypothetical protein